MPIYGVALKVCQTPNLYLLLYECDLYAELRAKLITQLNKIPTHVESNNTSNEITHHRNIDIQSLKENFMKLLSPYTNHQFDNVNIDQYNYHHSTVLNNNEICTSLNKDHILYRRSRILNIICTFTYIVLSKTPEI